MAQSPSDFDAWAPVLRDRRGVRLALGSHPLAAEQLGPDELTRFSELAEEVSYVGEVGLDGSREGRATLGTQRRVFDRVLAVAGEGRRVLSVHSSGAEAEVIDALAAAGATGALHWYSGPLSTVDRALDAGLYFSVNSAMLATQSGARLLRAVPHDRRVTESDGPSVTVARRQRRRRYPGARGADRWRLGPRPGRDRPAHLGEHGTAGPQPCARARAAGVVR